MIAYGQDTTLSGKKLAVIPVIELVKSPILVTDISHSGPRYIMKIKHLEDLGVFDVGSAFKYLPGVEIKDFGGIGGIKTISYRSLSGNYTSLQYDRILRSNSQTGVLNLNSFQLFGVSEVEFTSGQPQLWSSSASSYLSVNNICIQSKLFDRPDSFSLQLYQSLSTLNSFESGGYFTTPITKSLHLGLQVLSRYGSGEYDFVYPKSGSSETMTRSNSTLLNPQARLVIGYEKGIHAIKFSGSTFFNEQQLPGAVILYNPSNDQSILNRNHDASLQYHFEMNKWKMAANTYYRTDYTHYHDPEYLNLKGYISSTYEQNNSGGGVILNRQLRHFNERLFAGIDLIHSNLTSSEFEHSPERNTINSVIGIEKWLGRLKVDANLSAQFIQDVLSESDVDSTQKVAKLSPYLALSYLPFKKQKLRFRTFYKHTYRLPTFNDLYYNFIGNPDLQPEEAHIFNGGTTFAKQISNHRIEVTLDAYYTEIANKILAIPTKDIFNWSMQNIGKTQSTGVDFNWSYQYSKNSWNLTTSSSINYNSTVDVTNVASLNYGHQLPYVPRITASLSAVPEWKGYSISVNGIYSGVRYALNENIPTNQLDPFVDFNLGLAKAFKFGSSTIWCSAKVMNVLGKNYEVVRSFPMPGRSYQLTIKYKYR